jgi:hypothetical protein
MKVKKLAITLTLASIVALPIVFQSTSADAAACRIAGRWYSGRCPDRVAGVGYDGRMHWYHNRVYCMRNGSFSHWGHC